MSAGNKRIRADDEDQISAISEKHDGCKIRTLQLNSSYTSCGICHSKYSTDINNKDDNIRKHLPVLSASSKSCDHYFCHGCILRQQAAIAEENDGKVPKWISCMVCRTKTAFCPSQPKYHRMLIDILKQSKWTDMAQVKEEPKANSETRDEKINKSLLAYNPKEIAALGRHDEKMLLKLKSFNSELGSELDKVKEARQTDEAVKTRDMMLQKLKSNKQCMECKGSNLKFCAQLHAVPDNHQKTINELTSDAEVHCGRGNDSILCDSCLVKKKDELKFCNQCGHFLCKECMSEAKECGSEGGGGCNEYYCYECILINEGFQCCSGCVNWFCPSCMEGKTRRRVCQGYYESCGEVDEVCVLCEDHKYCYDCTELQFYDES